MNTIVIPVSDKRPEDNILDLVNLIQQEFGEAIAKVSNALVIETENPHVAAIFKQIAENNGPIISNGKPSSAFCLDCGKPVKKEGNRCKSCANKFFKKKEPKIGTLHEFITETDQNGADHGIGE